MGLIIFAVGLYLANVAYRAIISSGLGQSALLALIARIGILVLAVALFSAIFWLHGIIGPSPLWAVWP